MSFESHNLPIRQAGEDAAGAIASLINREFTATEDWFVEGDRTTPDAVRALIASPNGVFFTVTDEGSLVGCVYAERRSALRGYVGLLAVDASRKGQGIGPRLMATAERHLADAGCTAIDITVVNLRTELFPFYERLGYRAGEVLPFPRQAKQPCHLVTMSKELEAGG